MQCVPFFITYYQTVVLAAVMMRAAAKIKPEDLLYLRRAAQTIEIESVQAQFLSALDHYRFFPYRTLQASNNAVSIINT